MTIVNNVINDVTENVQYTGEDFEPYTDECPFCGETWEVTPKFMPYGCPFCGAT